MSPEQWGRIVLMFGQLPQAFITDLAAHQYVIDDINKLADSMVKKNHSRKRDVQTRVKEINDRCHLTIYCHQKEKIT
jgi:hypothetical protein